MRNTRRSFAPGVALLTVSLVGCGTQVASEAPPGSAVGTIRSSSPAPAAWAPSPAGPGETIYPGFGLRTSTPPAGTVAPITAQNAIAAAGSSSPDLIQSGLMPGTPSVVLQLMTDGDFAPDSSGSVMRTFVNRLVWVLTYHNSPVKIIGRAYGQPSGSLPPQQCDLVVAVDASSGAVLETFQSCHLTSP